MNKNPYILLCNRDILNILDGDTEDMPYLTGPQLCSISTRFGNPLTYDPSNAWSRWMYLRSIIETCAKNNKCQLLLNFLFSKEQFSNFILNTEYYDNEDSVDESYHIAVNTAMKKINDILYFSDFKLECINGNISLISLEENKLIFPATEIKKITPDYIQKIYNQAQQEIENNHFESAITKTRTLLEEVFCFLIEEKNDSIPKRGKIKELYNKIKTLYSLHPNQAANKSIKELLSGFCSIVDGITEIRNMSGDAHGYGKNRINMNKDITELLINSAVLLCNFLLSVYQNEK